MFFPHCMPRFSPCFQRTGCSTPDPPHLSVSTRSFSLLTHVGSSGISTLHSAEPTFSATEPHRCRIEFQKAAGNLIHDHWWGAIPVSTTTPAYHDQRQYTGVRPAPHTYQGPVSATRFRARGNRHRYLPMNPWAEGLHKFIGLSYKTQQAKSSCFLHLLLAWLGEGSRRLEKPTHQRQDY